MRALMLALCGCLLISITGCEPRRIKPTPVVAVADPGQQESDEETSEAMEMLKQYGNKSEAKKKFMKELRLECPGFTPTSGMAKHAECLKRYREFVSELNKM